MRFKLRHLLALAIPASIAIGIACSGPYGNQCASLNGVCVTGVSYCGYLPYECSTGVCCDPSTVVYGPDGTVPPPGAPPSTGDSSVPTGPTGDSSGGSPESSTGTPDSPTSNDTGPIPSQDATQETSTPVDAPTSDVEAPDTGAQHDGATDASHHDGGDAGDHHDASSDADHYDGSTKDAEVGCLDYAAPDTLSTCTACTALDHPDGEACQTNGCFGGYYCHDTALPPACTKTAKCDGGT
jgi:hypothetical protein